MIEEILVQLGCIAFEEDINIEELIIGYNLQLG